VALSEGLLPFRNVGVNMQKAPQPSERLPQQELILIVPLLRVHVRKDLLQVLPHVDVFTCGSDFDGVGGLLRCAIIA
jgi:hypothetical protein